MTKKKMNEDLLEALDGVEENNVHDDDEVLTADEIAIKEAKSEEELESFLDSVPGTTSFNSTVGKISKRKLKLELTAGTKPIPTRFELRKLVSTYYRFQQYRIIGASQLRASQKQDIDSPYIEETVQEYALIEHNMKTFLDVVTDMIPVTATLKEVPGIGPVISAGLYAHLDISRACTAGSYWRYAGIDPTVPAMKKGEKLKYNKELKTLVTFKLGDSFIKVQNRPNDIYGKYYKIARDYYEAKNEAGDYAERAKEILASKNFDKTTKAYKAYSEGKLPTNHIHHMARRKPVTLFLSHMFDLQYQLYHGTKSPAPYILTYPDETGAQHVHEIENELIKIYEDKYGRILK